MGSFSFFCRSRTAVKSKDGLLARPWRQGRWRRQRRLGWDFTNKWKLLGNRPAPTVAVSGSPTRKIKNVTRFVRYLCRPQMDMSTLAEYTTTWQIYFWICSFFEATICFTKFSLSTMYYFQHFSLFKLVEEMQRTYPWQFVHFVKNLPKSYKTILRLQCRNAVRSNTLLSPPQDCGCILASLSYIFLCTTLPVKLQIFYR